MWPEVKKVKDENRFELNLSGNEVTERIAKGGLDPAIFELTRVNLLTIQETALTTLPDSIGNLTNLTNLTLHKIKLESLNPNIGKLAKLKYLNLSNNNLTEIPPNIDELRNLIILNITNNRLESFPKLTKTDKLTNLALSNNKLREFPDICRAEFAALTEVRLGNNQIEAIPAEITALPKLHTLDLNENKITDIPVELADCPKLKNIDLTSNPISNRQLLKAITQKKLPAYIKQQRSKGAEKKPAAPKNDQDTDEEDDQRLSIKIKHCDEIKIVVDDKVKAVRPFLVACLITNVHFTEETYKKFFKDQNELHDTVCSKRMLATIATHDFDQLPSGQLTYTTLQPDSFTFKPLNRGSMTGTELYRQLQAEAEARRKEKKRSGVSNIHRYLGLVKDHQEYAVVLNACQEVISLPPLTNAEISKVSQGTKRVLVEVTGDKSLQYCKDAMEALLKKMMELFGRDLEVTQIRTADPQGKLRTVYPSREDLKFHDYNIVRS